jgi:hypothetical protein
VIDPFSLFSMRWPVRVTGEGKNDHNRQVGRGDSCANGLAVRFHNGVLVTANDPTHAGSERLNTPGVSTNPHHPAALASARGLTSSFRREVEELDVGLKEGVQ